MNHAHEVKIRFYYGNYFAGQTIETKTHEKRTISIFIFVQQIKLKWKQNAMETITHKRPLSED